MINEYKQTCQSIDKNFRGKEQKDISYFVDRMILDYPYFHENHTGKRLRLSKSTQIKLKQHLDDFNNPDILLSKDFKGYVEAFLRHQSSVEVKKEIYKKSDNKRLYAYLNLIPQYFADQECKESWQYQYFFNHLDNCGSKNIGNAVKWVLANCKNASCRKTIDSIYTESAESYKGHLIKTYKTVDGFNLDLHIFSPNTSYQKTKRPVIVYFSDGSWTEETPKWDFYNCENYAKKGWFGEHPVLTTALSNEVNEKSDNLNFSALSNLLLVNADVYCLVMDESTDWIRRKFKNKSTVEKISPQNLRRKGLPPMLIIHGTNDSLFAFSSNLPITQSLTVSKSFKTVQKNNH